jgi:ABC-type glycerol-3-phosphate transport system permease component
MPLFEQLQNRREFLRSCARNVSLTALGLAGGTFLVRKQIKRSSHECINEGICDGCRVFSGCILPQAKSAKAALDNKK